MINGEVVTLGSLERSIARLLSDPFDPDKPEIREPSQEELLKAIAAVRPAYGKRSTVISPRGEHKGVLQPQSLGLRFIYFSPGGINSEDYSAEMLQARGRTSAGDFLFSTTKENRAVFPLHRVEYVAAYVALRIAGIRSSYKK